MGTDDFFKRKRAEKEARKYNFRELIPNSFLIVSEGKKTEPYYFEGLREYIVGKYGGSIDIESPKIDIEGKGKCTVSLIEEAVRIVSKKHILFEHVWVVFDKDNFDDFDEAIDLAKSFGFEVAWSNQSFEYWLFLHFYYSDAALHRDDWEEKLDEIFKHNKIGQGYYEKNLEDIFDLVTANGGLKTAIANSKRIEATYKGKYICPSKCDPCTKVQNLILQLEPFLTDLL